MADWREMRKRKRVVACQLSANTDESMNAQRMRTSGASESTHLRWEEKAIFAKCLALLKCRKRRNRTEARQGPSTSSGRCREERSEKVSEKYLAHLAHHAKT